MRTPRLRTTRRLRPECFGVEKLEGRPLPAGIPVLAGGFATEPVVTAVGQANLGIELTNFVPRESGPLQAIINWGDGTTSTGTVTEGAQTETDADYVLGSHTYTEALRSTIGVAVFDVEGDVSVIADPVTVYAGKLGATAAEPIQGLPGLSVPASSASSVAVLAQFQDVADLAPGDLSAEVNWGDGTSIAAASITPLGAGNLTPSGAPEGGHEVQGSHTYEVPGTYSVAVTITDKDGLSTTATTTATVSPAAPHATPADLAGRDGPDLGESASRGPPGGERRPRLRLCRRDRLGRRHRAGRRLGRGVDVSGAPEHAGRAGREGLHHLRGPARLCRSRHLHGQDHGPGHGVGPVGRRQERRHRRAP